MKHILISRTDAIGDVVLTLPMAGYLRLLYPAAKILFLGRTYTGPVIRCCTSVDEFIDYNDLLKLDEKQQIAFLKHKHIDTIIHVLPNKHIAALGKRAGIKTRIGTRNRVFHWFSCNVLVKLSRKKSDLHEAQLNLVLLKPLGLESVQTIPAIVNHNEFKPTIAIPARLNELLVKDRFNLILHPKSHGSGVEWGLDKFKQLAEALAASGVRIFITGSDKEQALLADWVKTLPANVTDVTGQLTLDELIAFIAASDGLVASGTGPLHLAGALGVHTLGLFPSSRPIHPGRWAPIGKKAEYLESDGGDLRSITVDMVANKINTWRSGCRP
ncbi:glycosyl transferase family 9 [Mucilaginibacter sp. PAMC 26640]|nr:glycosyl transferase family 9 [Mucilaginibacter sp. PAMC 26640]